MNGREFDFYDEVPQRPHPNCRCKVKIVEGKSKFLNINGVNTIDSAHQSQLSQVVSLSKQPPVLSAEELAVNEVYNYLQKYNGKIPNTKITENISWREMIGNDNTDEERMYECTKEILTNVYRTAQQLQKIHDIYWQGRPLIISSGWRSVRNNRINGGKSKIAIYMVKL